MLEKIRTEFKQAKTFLQFGLLRITAEVTPLVVAKFFSPELFASYSLAKMIIFLFTSMLIASAQAPFIVFANQERAKTGRISKSFSVQCIFLLASGLIFFVATLLFWDAIAKFAELSSTGMMCMMLAFVGIAINSFLENLLMALGERIKSSTVSFLFGTFILVFVIALYFAGRLDLNTLLLTYLASGVVVALIFIKSLDIKLLFPFDFNWAHFKEMFDFTKWIMLGATAIYLINWADNFVLKIYKVSMADIGDYNLAYQIFKGTLMLVFVINNYFLPFVSEHIEDSAKVRNYLYSKRPKIFFIGTAAIGLLFFVAPYILATVYNNTYPKAASVLWILLVAAELMLYTTFYLPLLNALKKYQFSQTITVIQMLINVILDFILIPKFGLQGAAVSTAIAYLGTTVTLEVYFRIRLKKILLPTHQPV